MAEPDPDPGARRDRRDDPSVLEAAPGLVRIAAGAWWRTTERSAQSTIRASRRVGRAALTGESPLGLLSDARDEVLGAAQKALGVSELQGRLSRMLGGSESTQPLRERGYELLTRSSELGEQADAHPAYARILSELSPDEARILRLLATDGPQPAVDIRTWRPLDVGSVVVAPGLSMIGVHAGCRHRERVPAYLSNLFRLGLIWFSREELPDPSAYQVLEAQPDVIDAVRATGRARIVRRGITLTPFGGHFCEYCLPVDTAEFEALSEQETASRASDVR